MILKTTFSINTSKSKFYNFKFNDPTYDCEAFLRNFVFSLLKKKMFSAILLTNRKKPFIFSNYF